MARFLELENPAVPITEETISTLKQIVKHCLMCVKFGSGLRRVGIAPALQYIFNKVVALFLFWLHGMVALSMVDVLFTFGNAVVLLD